jgi:hypothetical protein
MPNPQVTDELERQIGFELLSIFKGAPTESIDEAVARVLSVRSPNEAELVAALQYAQRECRLYLMKNPPSGEGFPSEEQYLADRVAANCERVLAKIGSQP